LKFYLSRNLKEIRETIHGEGGYQANSGCGKTHEFMTRKCSPILFTEEDVKDLSFLDEFVEVSFLDSDSAEKYIAENLREISLGC